MTLALLKRSNNTGTRFAAGASIGYADNGVTLPFNSPEAILSATSRHISKSLTRKYHARNDHSNYILMVTSGWELLLAVVLLASL